MIEAILICALSLPASSFTRPAIVSWQASQDEESKLIDWLKKGGAEEVFIHEKPQEDLLKNNGWERVPILWKGNKIFIKRKPVSDEKKLLGAA